MWHAEEATQHTVTWHAAQQRRVMQHAHTYLWSVSRTIRSSKKHCAFEPHHTVPHLFNHVRSSDAGSHVYKALHQQRQTRLAWMRRHLCGTVVAVRHFLYKKKRRKGKMHHPAISRVLRAGCQPRRSLTRQSRRTEARQSTSTTVFRRQGELLVNQTRGTQFSEPLLELYN